MEFYLSGNHFTLVPNIASVLLNIKNCSRRIVYGSVTLGSPCILPPPSDLHQKAKTPSKRTHKALNYTYAFLKEALRSRTIWNRKKTCSSSFPALMSSQSVQFGRDFIPGLSLDPLPATPPPLQCIAEPTSAFDGDWSNPKKVYFAAIWQWFEHLNPKLSFSRLQILPRAEWSWWWKWIRTNLIENCN